MEENRIIAIILAELENEKLIHEEELERLLNSKLYDTKARVNMIKSTLSNITIVDSSITKLKSYLPNSNNTKKTKKLITENN